MNMINIQEISKDQYYKKLFMQSNEGNSQKKEKKVRNIDILIENDEIKEQYNYTEATEFKNISMMNDKIMNQPEYYQSDS